MGSLAMHGESIAIGAGGSRAEECQWGLVSKLEISHDRGCV